MGLIEPESEDYISFFWQKMLVLWMWNMKILQRRYDGILNT